MKYPKLFRIVIICCLTLVLFRLHWKIGFGIPITLLSLTSALIGFHYAQQTDKRWKMVIISVLLAIILARGLDHFRSIQANYASPSEFDYYPYWAYGQASSHGLNPYVQANLIQFIPFFDSEPSASFMDQFYFFQAPPAIFMFAPLGWFDFHTGVLVWDLIHECILLIVIVLLWRYFSPTQDVIHLLAIAVMVLLYPPTMQNIWLNQVNFLALLMILLIWRTRDTPQAGFWFAIGIFVKPIILLLGFYFLFKRQWRGLFLAFLTMLVASALTIIVYRPTMFFSYFVNNTIANQMTVRLYYLPENQSLLGVLLRLTHYCPNFNGAPLSSPAYWILASILIGISAWLSLQTERSDWSFALIISLALLLLPITLWHYSFYLLVPIMLILQRRHHIAGGAWSAFMLIFVVYILTLFFVVEGAFWVNLFIWMVCASVLLRDIVHSRILRLSRAQRI